MTTFFKDIDAALDARLNTMVGLPSVAWPNKKFEPTLETLYLRPTNLQGETVPVTNEDMTVGVYQIDVFAESGNGNATVVAMADTITDHFKHGTEMVSNSIIVESKTVKINNINNDDNGWIHLAVEVEYFSFTARR